MKMNKVLGLSIIAAVLCPLESMAAQVFVENAGFESNLLADGGNVAAVTGWNITGSAGTFNPASGSMPGGNTPEGNNMAYINGGSLEQAVGAALSANTIYTLTMDVIKRSEGGFQSAPYLIELLAGSDVIAQDNNSLSVSSGGFNTSMLVYEALPGDSLLGSILSIRISGDPQTSFDQVVLDAASSSNIIATPIPAALPLFVSALGLMGFTGWKRKKTL